MKGKSKVTELKQRKKGNKHNDHRKSVVEEKQPKTIGNVNEDSMKELKKIKEALANGSSLNNTEKNEKKQVKDGAKKEHGDMNGVFHPSINVFHRLSSMFKELRIDWLRQIFKERDINCEKRKDLSRLEYFNKEFIASFILVLILAIVTRTYKVEEPSHVWCESSRWLKLLPFSTFIYLYGGTEESSTIIYDHTFEMEAPTNNEVEDEEIGNHHEDTEDTRKSAKNGNSGQPEKTKNEQETVEEKAYEQSELDSGTKTNEVNEDIGIESSLKESDVDLLGMHNEKDKRFYIVLGTIWIFSLFTRLYDISQPPKICWDETHFGKFASYYINGKFFFDVHPPLGKMFLALAGWMSGYSGGFPFDKPGDLYGEEKYVGMRIFCSLLGGFCVPLAFLIVYELTKSLPAAIISASLILFDHGTLTLSRFILLDSVLMFFMMMAIFSLVKFQSWSDHPFSIDWWGWMFCTGYFLACTFSVKWVGLFVILLAGLVTVKQLWDLLGDLNLSMFVIGQHFMARVLGLIILPVLTYMFFFGVHFKALPLSGSGDGFFSSRFQSTLQGNNLYQALLPNELAYGSVITLKNNKPGGVLLHSHHHLYPKEHPPEQQQVTGYSHKDPNNDWLVKKPTNHALDPNAPLEYVKDGDIIRLEHVMTKRNLHTHNEKAPLTTNLMQVSGYGDNGNGDSNDDWKIVVTAAISEDSKIQSVKTTFKLIHANTGCALGETDKTLPKWGWEQKEMACYPNKEAPGTKWNVEGHINNKVPLTNMELMAPSFLEKIYESHIVMAQTNSGFKPKEGEVTSRPWQWPINYRGQVFSGGDHRIYLLGNPIIWWGILVTFVVFIFAYAYHAIREQRGYKDDIRTKAKRDNAMQSCVFLIIGWALHYLPFYAMGRVLYFHHYFPAYLLSAMFSGIFLEYLCGSITSFFKNDVIQKRIYNSIFFCLLLIIFMSFYVFRGLTYGMSGPMGNDPNSTQAAYKWLESWEI